MNRRRTCGWLSSAAMTALSALGGVAGFADAARAAGPDVVRTNGHLAKTLLGDGTGVVVGVIDSGVDDAHPALAGTVSGGLPRMVAEANFVTTEPSNTGDDVYGHGTAVMGVIGSRDSTFFGIATDARYVNARVLNSGNGFNTDAWVVNGAGFAVQQGANLLNLSLGYSNFDTSGLSKLALMSDYISYGRRIPVVVAAGNSGNNTSFPGPRPQGPGDAYNVFSAAATESSSYDKVASFSSYGPTTDGRVKPDLAAPGHLVATANDDWELGPQFASWSGTSFAAPNVAGLLAAQMEYGATNGLSRDPLVLKATMLNSAEKVNDRNNAPWAPNAFSTSGGVLTVTSPLNTSAGAGQIDGLALHQQYSPGEMSAGVVGAVGWDLANVAGTSSVDYALGALLPGSDLAATLTWDRKVGWTDDGDGVIDAADNFSVLETLDNLDLQIFRDGALVAQSIGSIDNLEHLYLTDVTGGDYLVRVTRLGGGGADEMFALAWRGVAVPEPASAVLALIALAPLAARRRRRRRA